MHKIYTDLKIKLKIKKWYNSRMRTGGSYDKRKVRHNGRHWGRPVQDDDTLLSANDV